MFKGEEGAELDAGVLKAPCGLQLGLAPPRKHKGGGFRFGYVSYMDLK